MLAETDHFFTDEWDHSIDLDPRCEFCARSIVTRFPNELPPAECPTCKDDFDLLYRADKIREDGWSLVVIKIGEGK